MAMGGRYDFFFFPPFWQVWSAAHEGKARQEKKRPLSLVSFPTYTRPETQLKSNTSGKSRQVRQSLIYTSMLQ